MLKILETAIAAREREDWSSVSRCLQQLPLDRADALSENEAAASLQLALQVLQATDFQQRWEIAKILPKFGNRAIAPLIELLEDEKADLEIRWFVGRILSQFNDSTCAIALMKLMEQTQEEELCLMASQSLASMGTEAIEALSILVEDEGLRGLAVRALAQIRHSETIEPLLGVVNDANAQIRGIAIEALGSFHDERVLPVLLKALEDPAADVRKEAIIALGFRHCYSTQFNLVGRLKTLLYDLNLAVCQQAAIALGRMGTDDAADALFPLLEFPMTPFELKLTILRALSWMETTKALNYLRLALLKSDGEVCRQAIALLGHTRLPALKKLATEILLDFFYSQPNLTLDLAIKQAFAMSLGQLGEAAAIEPLVQLSNDREAGVRLHAIAALKKFDRDLVSILPT